MQRPLAAFVDIALELVVPRGVGPTRRRTLTGVGRYPSTLQAARAELNVERTNYVLLAGSPAPPPPLLDTLLSLLRQSAAPLTRQELLAGWPGPAPRGDSLWRTVARGVEHGLFTVSGTGTKGDALRYG